MSVASLRPPVDTVAVRLHGVSKCFGSHAALDRIDIAVAPGTSVAVTGPNGAGKSTLLDLIAGTSVPSAGGVALAGAGGADGHRGRGPLLGVLNHATMLYDRLTGRENLLLHAAMRRVPRARVDAVLAQVELLGDADRLVCTYSHGMRKRLSIARALLHDPAVLVLDEPFAGLDSASQARLGALLDSLRGDKTVLFSSHEPERVAAHADRVLVLEAGHLAADRLVSTPVERGVRAGTPPRRAVAPGSAPAGGLVAFVGTLVAVLRKDLVLEVRTRTTTIAMLMLAGLLATVLGMSFEPLGADPAVVGGALWVLVTFTVLHGLARSFDAEFKDRALDGLLLTGADPAAIFIGKMLGTTLLVVLVALASTTLIALFFTAPALLGVLPQLLALLALAAVGLTAVGAVATVIGRHLSLGETLLPLLVLPLVVPVLLAGIASVPVLLDTGALHPGWLRVLVLYDAGMVVGAALVFEHVLEG